MEAGDGLLQEFPSASVRAARVRAATEGCPLFHGELRVAAAGVYVGSRGSRVERRLHGSTVGTVGPQLRQAARSIRPLPV